MIQFLLFQVKRENTEKVALKLGNVTIKKKTLDFMAPFYGWGSTVSTGITEPLWRECLLFTTKSPEDPGTQFFDLRRMTLGPRPCWICNLRTKYVYLFRTQFSNETK